MAAIWRMLPVLFITAHIAESYEKMGGHLAFHSQNLLLVNLFKRARLSPVPSCQAGTIGRAWASADLWRAQHGAQYAYRYLNLLHPSFSKKGRAGVHLSSNPKSNEDSLNSEDQPTGLEGLTKEEIDALPDLNSFVREGVQTIEEIMEEDIRCKLMCCRCHQA